MTVTPIQIRFADVDVLGHVNNVNLQHYFDLGKAQYYKQVIGVPDDWRGGLGLITASTAISYFAQTRPTEEIEVQTSVPKIGNKSMTFVQRIVNGTTGEVKAESTSVLVAFDFAEQDSVSVPQEWRERIAEHESME